MMLTIPPVVYIIFRYLYLIYDRSDDRSTAAIVAEDKGMIAGAAELRGDRLPAALRLQVIEVRTRPPRPPAPARP